MELYEIMLSQNLYPHCVQSMLPCYYNHTTSPQAQPWFPRGSESISCEISIRLTLNLLVTRSVPC